ncbi:MAG: biotin transporter BioY [Clostridia bacterium]|nr:biotin transporter BioY [Clostridia bacterium]
MKKSTSVALAKTAILTALICVVSPFSVPLPSGVSVSLATFIIFLASAVLTPFQATVSVLVYLFIGAVGVPVFQNFSGGFYSLIGPTGGYLLAYPICALVSGLIIKNKSGFWRYALAFFVGTVIIYLIGAPWCSVVTTGGLNLKVILTLLITFLPFDIIKMICASALANKLNKKLKNAT